MVALRWGASCVVVSGEHGLTQATVPAGCLPVEPALLVGGTADGREIVGYERGNKVRRMGGITFTIPVVRFVLAKRGLDEILRETSVWLEGQPGPRGRHDGEATPATPATPEAGVVERQRLERCASDTCSCTLCEVDRESERRLRLDARLEAIELELRCGPAGCSRPRPAAHSVWSCPVCKPIADLLAERLRVLIAREG